MSGGGGSSEPRVAVVGAGIVGLSTAIWLRRYGAEVTVVDRAGPAAGASFGNAGVLAASGFVPALTAAMLRQVPRMLADRDAPLFLRYPYAPRLWPWARRAVSHAGDAAVRRIARALAPLVTGSVEEHHALTEGLSARAFLQGSDYAFAYADRAAFEAARPGWELKREHGFDPEVLEGGAVQDYEPALGDAVGCLAVLRGHGYVADPAGYVAALADDLRHLGGDVRRAEVLDMRREDGRVTALVTDRGEIPCDAAVIAGGVATRTLLGKLGVAVPMESERGYHLQFDGLAGAPKRPVMVAAGAFVATPMARGLRCAGTLELGGTEAGPSRAPLEMIRRRARAVFPGLAEAPAEEWLGHRPAPPDSLPLLGEVGRTGVFAATGHHHVGLTAGPVSGRLIAAAITGRKSEIDLAPYRPERFS